MVLPLRTADRGLGALIVARAPGDPAFTEKEAALAGDFAGRAAVALELVRAREAAQRMLLFEDRGRIARDLHDRVIQQLFATGMQLQGVLGSLPPGRDAERVDAAISSLDDSITQIRRIIFTLQSTGRTPERSTGRQRLFDLIERQAAALSVEPAVTVTGPIDSVLDGDLAEDVLAAVGEGISNAVKHAGASDIAVVVRADGRGVTVTVSNDGLPLAHSGRRSGLGNLEERARRRRGAMTLEPVDGSTVLTWAVPLRREPVRTG
jgi:signal transduction histidine kinase